ncbi:hypothetical protein [Dactylosporangium sp. CA-092794]|uniref:hypothetical protein n=1 Tax=Dactylosporangium sp. CA-092794 TaxID=3239929 RepID=UPI003D8C49FB
MAVLATVLLAPDRGGTFTRIPADVPSSPSPSAVPSVAPDVRLVTLPTRTWEDGTRVDVGGAAGPGGARMPEDQLLRAAGSVDTTMRAKTDWLG